jgi:hypothetical protein
MLFPLVLLLSIQTVVGVRWDEMGPTGPYVHKDGPNADGVQTDIAQLYHASFTTPALATVRQLWEVSTAFPFFWFPVEFGEAQAAIDEHYYGTEGDDTPSRFVAFCQTWMGGGGGGTEVAGTEAAGSGGGGIGGREEGDGEEDGAQGAARGGGGAGQGGGPSNEGVCATSHGVADFGVVDWMCHAYKLRKEKAFGRFSTTKLIDEVTRIESANAKRPPREGSVVGRAREAERLRAVRERDKAASEEVLLLKNLRETLCRLRQVPVPGDVYFHPHVVEKEREVQQLVEYVPTVKRGTWRLGHLPASGSKFRIRR